MTEALNDALARHGLSKERVPFRGGVATWLTRDGERVGVMDEAEGWCLVAMLEGRTMDADAGIGTQDRARQLLLGLRGLAAARSGSLNEALARHGLATERVPAIWGWAAATVLTRDGERIGPVDDEALAQLLAMLDGEDPPPTRGRERARQLLAGLRAMDAAKAAEGES